MKVLQIRQLNELLDSFALGNFKSGSNVTFRILKTKRLIKTVLEDFSDMCTQVADECRKEKPEATSEEIDEFAFKQSYFSDYLAVEHELELPTISLNELEGSDFNVAVASELMKLNFITE